jgi:hypothetical protein
MGKQFQDGQITRRQFLRHGMGAGLVGVSLGHTHHPSLASEAHSTDSNAFAYDVSHLAKIDRKLIQYQERRRYPCPHEDARRIAVGPDARLYLLAGEYVTITDLNGSTLGEIVLSGPARCLAPSPTGELYVGLRDHVEVFDAKGQHHAAWAPLGRRAWLTGIALSKDSAFLADAGNRVLLRCDRVDGKVVGRIGEKNKEHNAPGFIVPSPFFDVELHSDGLLRVTNPGRHRVEAYTLDGDFEFAWGKASAAIDGFCGCCNPIAIALLPDGRVVTAEKGLPRVKVYAADGTFESVVAGPESFPENARSGAGDSPSDGVRAGLDVAADAQGQVYVLDQVAGVIHVFQRRN